MIIFSMLVRISWDHSSLEPRWKPCNEFLLVRGDPSVADMYNEMVPSSTDPTFLAAANRAVYDAMNAVDPQATYVMQAWLFHDPFWTADRVEAYLSDVPNDWMLILDLNSEQTPLWQQYDSYFKKPWVWCVAK